jgi:hypothetical protein
VPPGVQRQRRPAERRWGEGPRHPRTAWATCEWCQSTGCRRMATESHPMSHHGLPTGHRHCVHPCDRDRGYEPPRSKQAIAELQRAAGPKCGEQEPPPRVEGGSPWCVVDGRGGSGGCSGGEAKLLEKHIVLGLRKGGNSFMRARMGAPQLKRGLRPRMRLSMSLSSVMGAPRVRRVSAIVFTLRQYSSRERSP